MGQLGLGDMLNRGGASGEMGAALPAIGLGTGRSASSISVSDQQLREHRLLPLTATSLSADTLEIEAGQLAQQPVRLLTRDTEMSSGLGEVAVGSDQRLFDEFCNGRFTCAGRDLIRQ